MGLVFLHRGRRQITALNFFFRSRGTRPAYFGFSRDLFLRLLIRMMKIEAAIMTVVITRRRATIAVCCTSAPLYSSSELTMFLMSFD